MTRAGLAAGVDQPNGASECSLYLYGIVNPAPQPGDAGGELPPWNMIPSVSNNSLSLCHCDAGNCDALEARTCNKHPRQR